MVLLAVGAVIVTVIVVLGVKSLLMARKAKKDTLRMNEIMKSAAEDDRPGMYVDGQKLRDRSGSEVVMRGVNHAHSWFREYDETAFQAIADTGANAIRIVCACGIRWDSDDRGSLAECIEKARSLGMTAIVEVHDGTGNDDISLLEGIADYWCAMADVLNGTEDYCIVNIANEWGGKRNADLWRDGYTKVIPKLRAAGIRNVLMVDAAGWGQYGSCIAKYGVDVFDSDPCRNTMFSVHMYGLSGGAPVLVRKNLRAATEHGLCVCVGEFGWKHSDGPVAEDYIMKYCSEQGIGYLAWSWKGNSGGVEYLDMTSEWDGSALTEKWGDKVVNGEYGIKATSR